MSLRKHSCEVVSQVSSFSNKLSVLPQVTKIGGSLCSLYKQEKCLIHHEEKIFISMTFLFSRMMFHSSEDLTPLAP